MAPFIGQNIGEDQKKGLRCNELVFSSKVCDDQKRKKKEKKVFAYQSVGFWAQKKKTQMVSPQNDDTRAAPPSPLATPLVAYPPTEPAPHARGEPTNDRTTRSHEYSDAKVLEYNYAIKRRKR